MYEVSEKVLDDIKSKFVSELKEREYEYEDDAIDKIFGEWLNRKSNLIDLLSRHPNWDSEKLMVKFDSDFSREINTSVANGFVNWLRNYTDIFDYRVNFDNWDYSLYCVLRDLLCNSTYINDDEGSSHLINVLNLFNEDFNFRTGMKSTKIMGKVCKAYGWDKIEGTEVRFSGETVKYNAYEREYAKYCDAMCPIKVKRHTCISLNPIDYLLMSNGNSWRSCHYIGDYTNDSGCYSSGTISYMLDENSIVFYTVDGDYDGDSIETEKKLQRQIFGYNDHQLLQSRLYPQSSDYGAVDVYNDIRAVMQKVVSDCLNLPNLWVKRKARNVRHGEGATCYPDWTYQKNLCSTSVIKNMVEENLKEIVLGAKPICICCGQRHSETENINHCNTNKYTCEGCGCTIDEDDVYWIGDYGYCYECVTLCDYCNEYTTNDDTTYIRSEDRYVCGCCRDQYYSQCDQCGEWIHNDDMNYTQNDAVCDECLKKYYVECERCGASIYKDEAFEKVDEETGEVFYFCEDCHEED